MPSNSEASPSRTRWLVVVFGFGLSLFFLFGWFDQSSEATLVANASRVVIISDAGKVELSAVDAGEETRIHRRDSWLFSEPLFESAQSGDEVVVRVSCPGRFPCRSDLRADVPSGSEVVVLATRGVVDVRSHEGSLVVYSSSADGVVLGPIAGSARVLSTHGPVNGFHLALEDLEAVVERSPLRVSFSESPTDVRVVGADELVQIGVPQRFYRVVIETDSASVSVGVNESINSDRSIEVESRGPVRVVASDQ